MKLEEDVAPGGLRVPRQPLEMPARVTLEKPLVRFALVDAADARRLRRLRSRVAPSGTASCLSGSAQPGYSPEPAC